MLNRVELSAKCIGLNMTKDKTKYMSYNNNQLFNNKTIYGIILKRVDEFKQLGAWVDSNEKDVKIRKAQTQRHTCHRMRNIWKSTLSRKFKIRLMISTVLLYGCETWTLTNNALKNQTEHILEF